MADSNQSIPRLIILPGPGVSVDVVRAALHGAFEVEVLGERPPSPEDPAQEAIGGLTPSVRSAPLESLATLLNATGEGVALADNKGRSIWANDLFNGLDPVTLERLTRIGEEGATAMAAARRFLRAGDEIPPQARVYKSEFQSAGAVGSGAGGRIYDVMVSPVDSRPIIPPPAARTPEAAAAANTPPWPRAIAVVVRDVTDAARLRQRIDAIDQAGSDLVQIDTDTIRDKNMIERLQALESRIVQAAKHLLNFDHFAIRLLDEKTGKLELVIKHNLPGEYDAFEIYPRAEGNGITGWVAATGRSYICKDAQNDDLFLPGLHGAKSSLTVPMRYQGRVIGIINVESQQVAAFNDDDRRLCEIFARYIAMATHTLDLLVVERTITNRALAGRFEKEIDEPLKDISNEVDVLRTVAAAIASAAGSSVGSELEPHIDKIRADVDAIRRRIRDAAEGPTTLLGVERAMEQKTVDPLLAGRRILIADDQSKIRRIIGDVLRNRGCDVVLCEHGGEALASVAAVGRGELAPFDLLVSDIMMPEANGYEVFSAARKVMPRISVILMTGFGYDPNHSIVRASQEGLQSVLFKPFQIEQLVELVKKAIVV
jgi:two-component system, sensor histidine kinase SagS